VAPVLAAVAAACSAAGGAPSPSPSPPALSGRTFLSTAVTVNGTPKPLVDGTRIQVRFEEARLVAQAGCNQMSGRWALDGITLRVDELATTAMGCDPARHAQDEWLAAFLASGPVVSLSASALTLDGGGTTLTFVDRDIAIPDSPLIGTTWRLDTIFQGYTASSLAGVTATLRFGADGRVAVDTGCNTGSATWRAVGTGAGIAFGPLGLTKRACQGGAGQVEGLMVRVLSDQTVASNIDGPVLDLRNADLGLGFRDAAGG
jgi:heat shock protein HslJ